MFAESLIAAAVAATNPQPVPPHAQAHAQHKPAGAQKMACCEKMASGDGCSCCKKMSDMQHGAGAHEGAQPKN